MDLRRFTFFEKQKMPLLRCKENLILQLGKSGAGFEISQYSKFQSIMVARNLLMTSACGFSQTDL